MAKLPLEKSKPDLSFKNQKFGMIGAAGIGKSDFFAQEDGALFIEAEAGLNFIETRKAPARCWDDLRDIYGQLIEMKKSGKFPYTLIVVDTIDQIVKYAETEIVQRAGEKYRGIEINTIGDVPNGGGWSKTRELVMSFINGLEQLPCAIAYIGHLSIKRVDKGLVKYDRSTISLWAGVGNDMLAWADHIMHVEANMRGETLIRTVWTKPTQSREAKSRGGVIPNGWKWEEDMKVNYGTFRKLFK